MEYAKNFNMTCEIVSGVTSAIATPASVGIPITSRGFPKVFGWLREQLKKANFRETLNWQLSQKHGKSEMPMAIIQNRTRKNVKSVIGTVSTIIKKSISESIANPAVIVIGEVVGLSEQFISHELLANSYQ